MTSSKYFSAICLFFLLLLWHVPTGAQDRLLSAVPPTDQDLSDGIEEALAGNVEKARQLFAMSMQNHPEGRPGGIIAAMMFGDGKLFGKLRFWLEQTAEDYPNDPEAFFLLGDIALTDERFLEATMLAERGEGLLEKTPTSVERKRQLTIHLHSLKGGVAEAKKSWNEAAKCFRAILDVEPDNAEFLLRLGIVEYRRGNRDEAMRHLDQAAKTNTRLLPSLILLAQLCESENRTEEAVKFVEESLKIYADNPRVLLAAADLELRWNHLDKVRELAEKAQQLDDNSVDAVMKLGILDLYAEQYQEAEEKFLRLFRTMPNDVNVLTGLCLALCEQNEPRQQNRAMALARDNANRHFDSTDALATYAWVLFKMNLRQESEKILTRLFDTGDMNPAGAYYLAVLYAGQGRKNDAISFLKAALEPQGNFPKRAAAEKLLDLLLSQE